MVQAWPFRLPHAWKDTRRLVSLTPRLDVVDAAQPPAEVEVVRGQWPGIRVTDRRDSAEAGPTGAPWVDSNGWVIRLAAVRHPAKTIWAACEPPESTDVVPANRWVLGLADAAAHGGRWIVPLPGEEPLPALLPAMRFFDAHREWAAWPARAVLAFLSDFAGPNEFLSHELLNLTARRHLPYRILDKSAPLALTGLKAVVFPDAGRPQAKLRESLLAFAREGGMVIAAAAFGPEGTPVRDQPVPRWDLRALGKGRLALARAAFDDTFLVANDVHMLLSRRHDLVRLYNAGAWGQYLTASPRGHTLLHLLNYAAFPGCQQVTVWVAGQYRSAALHTFEGSRPLKIAPARGGVDLALPPVAVYAAIELE